MLQPLSLDESRTLREFLRDSGYNSAALQSRFARTDVPQLHLLHLYRLGLPLEPSLLHTLFRWFWIGSAVDAGVVRQFVPEPIVDLLLARGVLAHDAGGLVSCIRLSLFEGFYIASDHAVPPHQPMPADLVAWPSLTTLTCHRFMMPGPVERTLDLGTGNGLLAIGAAAHSRTVIATDINPRCREFCLFNASLNGVNNVEFRQGSAFEPVQGERFDLIIANPPFFVTPSVRRVFSDNSMELDGFCRMLIEQAPEHLTPNGYCQLLLEWVQIKDQPWRDRLGRWFEGLGCDAWALGGYSRSIADYSLIRIQDDHAEPAAQAALLASWLDYFKSRRVEAIHGGFVILRRRAAENWVRLEDLPAEPQGPFGALLRRMFDTHDYLGTHDDEALLDSRPAVAASASMHQRLAASADGWKLASIDLHLNEGLPVSLNLQPQVAEFLSLCDGRRTLREIAVQTAAAVHVDAEVVRRESCRIVRQFAGRGVLLVA